MLGESLQRELRIDAVEHMKWARMIARAVRAKCGFVAGSHEEFELESVAYITMVEACSRYDESRLPANGDLIAAFRGTYAREIRTQCHRAAERLRNGGIHHRNNNGKSLRVVPLPGNDGDTDLEIVDRRRPPLDDEEIT